MTLKQFKELYQEYKDTFDLELLMSLNRITYARLKEKQERSEEWL